MNNKQKTARDNRRYKYGSLSAVFTVVFLALILAINLIFSSLSLSGKLTVDLTPEEFTSVSEETVNRLGELGKDLDVTLYFMSPRDQFDLEANAYNGINLTGICRDLAENYANIFDGSGDKGTIKVEYRELNKDPEFEKTYLESTGTILTSTSIVVDGKYHDRVVDITSFYTIENGVYKSFRGENRLTAAILRASVAEQPVATLTYGHGEPVTAEGNAKTKAAGLVTMLSDAGFEVKFTDIAREAIDPKTKILITYAPNADFSNEEIDVLDKYIKDRNSYIVFVDATTPELNKLQTYLSYNWGINYAAKNRITDSIHSLHNKNSMVVAKKPQLENVSEDSSASYQLRKTVFDFEGAINTVFPESVELKVETTSSTSGVTVEKVLNTYETAVSENIVAGSKNEGEMPLMLLSTAWGYGENNAKLFSYVSLVGSTDFASEANLSDSYGNRRVMLSVARVFGSENVATDIEAKEFISTALEIENGSAKTLTWLICTIVPGIIMILGVVVYFRRRHL